MQSDIIDLTTPEASPGTAVVEENPLAVAKLTPPDVLLVVFVHGFKGTDETFMQFPERLQHILAESISNVLVECMVFPAYETKGVLTEAVDRFADWLVTLTVERENANGLGGGAGKVKIVLCGHSMGGLLIADTLRQMADARPDKAAPLWPRIIALIAFDTPYLGLHPFVFKNQASTAVEYLQSGYDLWQSLASPTGKASVSAAAASSAPATVANLAPLPAPPTSASAWSRWAMPAAYTAGSVLLAGALGTVYTRRGDIADGYTWLGDHFKYVNNLWDKESMNARLVHLGELSAELGVPFRNLYTYLPAKPPAHPSARTFCILPADRKDSKLWVPATNTLAASEIDAHTGMFAGATNDGYYQLGLEAVSVIREAIMMGRGVFSPETGETLHTP